MHQPAKFDMLLDSYSRQSDDQPIEVTHFPEIEVKGNKSIIDFIFGEMQSYPYCFFSISKRYRTSIIRQNNITYDTKINMGEDRNFVLEYLSHCESLKVIDSHSYIIQDQSSSSYRLSKGGEKSEEYYWRNFYANFQFLKNFNQKRKIASINRYADKYIAEKVFWFILAPQAHGVKLATYSHVRSDIRKVFWKISLNNVVDSRLRMSIHLIRIFGFGMTLKMLKYKFK